MKKFMLALFVTTSFVLTSCSDDDDNGNVVNVEETTTYDLTSSVDGSNMGSVTLTRNDDNTTTIDVERTGTTTAGTQTVHLHRNSAAATGESVLTLNDIDASTGISSTTFSTLDDGTEITYDQLLTYDGYIDVHEDGNADHSAYADIGVNELTGESKTYQLGAENDSEVDGTVTFQRRVNNTTLATVNLNNAMANQSYPIRIYQDNSIDGETPMFDLKTIDGNQPMGKTQVDTWNDGTEVTYDDIMNYDGHVRVHHEDAGVDNLMAMGDIGQNELSGNTQIYTMTGVDGTENGTFTLSERLNGEVVAKMEMMGTTPGINQAAYINSGIYGDAGSMPTGTLNFVNGANGISRTNLTGLDDGTEMDYDGWMEYDGNVTALSTTDPTSGVTSYANIGVNAE